MRNIGVALVAVLCAALAGGCVSKGKFRTLQEEHEETKGSLADREKKIVSLEEALAAEKKEVEGLKRQIASLEGRLAEAEGEVERVQGDLASVVKDRARLRASADELKNALAELTRRKAEAEKRVAQYRDLLARFQNLIDAGRLRVKIARGRMVLELPTDVLFPSGSAKLSDEGETAVSEVATVLATIDGREFQVEGHTDNVPLKSRRFPSTNWELAAARALNVVGTMVEAGMDPRQISAASFGEHRPVGPNDSDEGRARNRRIEIVIVPDLSKLPGFDELNRAVDGA